MMMHLFRGISQFFVMSSGKGLFLLALGAVMIFAGYFKTKPRSVDVAIDKWREMIIKWENLSETLAIDVSKDIQGEEPGRLKRMIQQLSSLSHNLDVLRTVASNVSFCKAVEVELPRYNCRRVNELIDTTEVKVSDALKSVNEALDRAKEEDEKRAALVKKSSSSSSSDEEEKNEGEDDDDDYNDDDDNDYGDLP